MEKTRKDVNKKAIEVKSYFETQSLYNIMKMTLSYMLKGEPIDFRLNVGGGSYTDGKVLVVGLMEDFLFESYETIYAVILALLGHESQHVLSSSFTAFERYNKVVSENLVKETGVGKGFASRFTHFMGNALEDGRIERILANKLPGIIPKLKLLNMYIWNINDIKEEDDDEVSALFSSILTISKLGILPKGFNKKYKDSELDKLVKEIQPKIIEATKAVTCQRCLDIAEEIIVTLYPFLKDKLKEEEDRDSLEEMFKDMMDELMPEEDYQGSEEEELNNNQKESIHLGEDKEDSSEDEGETSGGGSSEEEGSENDESSKGANNEEDTSEDEDESNDGDSTDNDDEASDNNQEDINGDSNGPEEDENKSEKTGEEDSVNKNDSAEQSLEEKLEEDIEKELDKLVEDIANEAQKAFDKSQREEKEREREEEYDKPISDEKLKEIQKNLKTCDAFIENGINFSSNLPIFSDVKIPANKFRREVSSIFDNKQGYNLNGQNQGIINPSDLHRVSMGDYNVFTLEGHNSSSDYVAYVLRDGSGSMYGNKDLESMKALAIIEEGLRDSIPFKLTSFNTNFSSVVHNVIRGFNQTSSKSYSTNYYNNNKASGANDDGYSISIATQELLDRPEPDKILIVLSDGMPDNKETTKEAIKKARKNKIHVIGICFGDEDFRIRSNESYKYMYERNIISVSPEKIPNALTKLFKQILVR